MNKKILVAFSVVFLSSNCYAKNKGDIQYTHPFFSACVSSSADMFEKCGLVSRNGLPVTPAKYQLIDKYQDIWLALKENGQTDVLDVGGNVIGTVPGEPSVPPRRTVIKISDNRLLAKKNQALYDYRGTLIHSVQSPEYYADDEVSDGMIGVIRVTDDGLKKGYMDINTGVWILEPVYSSISPFRQGYASVTLNKNNEQYSTIIDKRGKEILPSTPDISYYWISSNRWIKSYDSSGIRGAADIINDKGELLLAQVFIEPYTYSEHMALIKKSQTTACYVVKLPSMEEKRIADRCNPGKFSDGVIWLKLIQREGDLSQWALLDEYGKELFRKNYENVEEFHNGFAIVSDNNGHFGVIDKKGETIIPFEYSEITPPWHSYGQEISEDVWRVRKNGVNGYIYIDDDNEVIATLTSDHVPPENPCGKFNPVINLKNAQGETLWQENLEESCKAITSIRSQKE